MEELIKINDDTLLRCLRNLGAPLGSGTGTVRDEENALTPQEVLVRSLSLARRNPAVARVFPVVIARNRSCFDNFESVRKLAQSAGEADTLGFFLELTAELSGSDYFARLAGQLSEYRGRKVRSFFVPAGKSKYARHLDELNTPDAARRWNFRMNMNKESFASLFSKFGVSL
jgi:hypothetical protein